MFSKKFSDVFALVCLIGTVWTVVATSSKDGSFSGTYQVHSDCVSPVLNVQVTVFSSTIQSPAGYDFTTLGFPTNSLSVGSDNLGTSGGGLRSCKLTNRDGTIDDSFLYTCSDNGQFACNIYFTSI